MKQLMFPTVPAEERVSLLRDNADSVERTDYLAQLTNQEIEDRRKELVEVNIKLMHLNEERKAFLSELKAKLKPLREQHSELVEKLNTRTEKRKEMLYKMVDHADGRVGFYNSKGVLVVNREIMPEERQTQIKILELQGH